jgi:hypothetical protein
MVAAGLVPMFEAEARERMEAGNNQHSPRANLPEASETGRARDKAAEAVNVSPRSVESALKVVRECSARSSTPG